MMPPEASFHRIRRAKSAPSVQKRRKDAAASKPLESEVDRHHATTAASLAMAQAKDRMYGPPKPTTSSSEKPSSETSAQASARIIRRRPSLSSLTGEAITTGSNASDVVTSSHQAGNEADDLSPCRAPLLRDLQSLGIDGELSAPSSFRRLRKSRSMLTTKSLRNLRATGAPASRSEEADSPSLRRSTEFTSGPHRSLRHSLSFINGSIRRMKSHGALSARKPKIDSEPPVPPLPGGNGVRPARKPMRSTVRAMREYSPDDDDACPSSNDVKHPSKARSFSINIKKRLKRVFGFSSYDAIQSPASQASSFDSHLVFESPALSDECTLRPSLHSTRSSDSLATSTSRVTSWTDSTAGNTVKTRHTMRHQSLATIEEGFDSAGKMSPDHTEAYGHVNEGNRFNKVIDSQRVYSALMRHIGETAARDGDRIVSTGAVKGSPVIVERTPSVRTVRHHNGSIHKVPSDVSMRTARTSFTADRRPQSSQSSSYSLSQDYMAEGPITPLRSNRILQPSSRNSSRVNVRDSKPAFFPSGSSPRSKISSQYRTSMSSIHEAHDDSNIHTSRINILGTGNDNLADFDSPSVYSRSTSGRAASRDALDDELEEPFEPGMATIYDIQVPYKSPRRQDSPVMESGPKNSAEWKEWLRYEIDNLDKFDEPHPVRQREHHREDAECDGESLPQESHWDVITRYATNDKDKSYGQLRQTSSSGHDSPGPGFRAHEQNNFSRPMSRPSIGSLRAPALGQRPIHEAEIDEHKAQKLHPADPFFSGKSYMINNSPSRRQSIRAAREARLNRGRSRQNTLKLIDDQLDAKAVQFRSIRDVPSIDRQNRENEISPSVKDKYKGTGILKLEDLPKSTVGSKRMVDDFLDRRRVSRDSMNGESAFV